MEGRSRHCPHLGLKHTRSIRFASPTPEHRCYIFGEPLPIQVDQRTFCLGDRYPECPRFAGQEAPPVPAAGRGVSGGGRAAPRKLSKLERVICLSLVGLLFAILATYGVIVGLVLPARARTPTVVPTVQVVEKTPLPTVEATSFPSLPPTARPTSKPTDLPPTPTAQPTVQPTSAATSLPTSLPTFTPSPSPSATPVVIVPTVRPTVVPTAVPPPESMWSTLYFLGPDRSYYVPVYRQSRPWVERVATRAVELMIEGPRGGLLRTIPEGMTLNSVGVSGSTLNVDFGQTFEELGAGPIEAMGVVWALTEFSNIDAVQFMKNGVPVGLPGSGNTDSVRRPAYLNFEDPYNVDPSNATHLMLFFATPDGQYLVPIVRRVPHTLAVATTAISETIRGPSAVHPNLVRPIPEGTRILGISREGNTIVVDFGSEFLGASNRDLAVQSLLFAMVNLTADYNSGVTALRISVEGRSLGEYWGSSYSGDLRPGALNPEP